MDYKEKYEQALENLKKIKDANKDNKELVDFIEYKYPELKESEDDRIRKELWEYFHNFQLRSDCDFSPSLTIDDILAWLEKIKKFEDELERAYKTADEVQYRKGFEAGVASVEPVVSVDADAVRDDFVAEVYRILDADPTNDRANAIIDAFDSLPTVNREQHHVESENIDDDEI